MGRLHAEERRNAARQWGGGASHSTRNYHRWIADQLWITDGSNALDPLSTGQPVSPALKVVKVKPYHFDAGAVIGNGLIQIVRAFTRFGAWFYDLLFLGVELRGVRHDLVLETWRRIWCRKQKRSEAGTDATPAPASRMLPAPRNTIAGLLPAVCA